MKEPTLVEWSLTNANSTLAFMMRTFGVGFGDISEYFHFAWSSTYYLFEALLMPPVEVGP